MAGTLIAEDEPPNTKLAAFKAGPRRAPDARREWPDPILMDLQMPGMNGLEAMRLLGDLW